MAFEFRVQVENVKEVQRNLDLTLGLWRIITRRRLQEWGQELTGLAEGLSPQDKLRGIDPRRRSPTFGQSWEFNVHGRDPQLDVGNVDPVMEFIVFPTDPKTKVTSGGDYPLKFYTESGGPFYAWSIDIPAKPGQPVHLWALREFNVDGHIVELGQEVTRRS